MLFFSLYYDILSLTSLKITQEFHLLLGFVENQTVFWDFKIRISAWITEGSDNGDSDNRGPTIYININIIYIYIIFIFIYIVGPRLSKSPLSEPSVIRTLIRILKSQKTV